MAGVGVLRETPARYPARSWPSWLRPNAPSCLPNVERLICDFNETSEECHQKKSSIRSEMVAA